MKQINLNIYKNSYLIIFLFFILILTLFITYPLILQLTFFFLKETINKLYITSSLLYSSILILTQVIPLLIYKFYYILCFLGYLIFSTVKELFIYGTYLIKFPLDLIFHQYGFLYGDILMEIFKDSNYEKIINNICMSIAYAVIIILHIIYIPPIALYIYEVLHLGFMFWIQVLWYAPIINIIPGLVWKMLMGIYTWISSEIRDDFIFFSGLILILIPLVAQHFHKEYLSYRMIDLADSWTYLHNHPESDEVWERGKLYGREYKILVIKVYFLYKIITSIIPFLILTIGLHRLLELIGGIITPLFIIYIFLSFFNKWSENPLIILKNIPEIYYYIYGEIYPIYYYIYWEIYAPYPYLFFHRKRYLNFKRIPTA